VCSKTAHKNGAIRRTPHKSTFGKWRAKTS
jgi:hypothetical protein